MSDNKKEVKKAKEAKKETKKVKVSPNLKKIIDDVSKLSVIELADLVKALEEKFGVSAVPAAAVAAPGAAAPQGGDAKAEEKSQFDVILSASGANKIAVIKAVREIKPDLGLKEAKDLVEAAPKELLAGAKKEEAENAKKKLVDAGAQVELK